MPAPTLYSLNAGTSRDEISVRQVWAQTGAAPLAAGYKQLVTIAVAGGTYLLGFDADGTGAAFRLTPGAPWIAPVPSQIKVGKADIVEPFVLGMAPYLLAYEAQDGVFSYFPVTGDLTAPAPPYQFRHPRVPLTQGFTVTKPIVVNSLLYVLSYNFKTGDVDIWSLSVTPTPQAGSAPGTPPLLMLPVWVHQWAKSWSRFAFFTLGGEAFFFKINFGPKLNVNIDHVLDDTSQGTIEVGTWLQNQLADPTKIDVVAPFTLNGGDPYFVTYRTDGSTAWFRIHGDCQGWTKANEGATITGATQIVPFQIGDDRFALFY